MRFLRFKPAGRFADETNDCTVRALCFVTGAGYRLAHHLVRGWGRVSGQPFDVRDNVGAGVFGKRFAPVRVDYAKLPHVICGQAGFSARALNLAEFIAKHPRGVFYLCTADHAFAVLNGAVADLRKGLVSDDSAILAAWRVS